MEIVIVKNIDYSTDPSGGTEKIIVNWSAFTPSNFQEVTGSLTVQNWSTTTGASELDGKVTDANSALRETVVARFISIDPNKAYIVCGVGVCGRELVPA